MVRDLGVMVRLLQPLLLQLLHARLLWPPSRSVLWCFWVYRVGVVCVCFCASRIVSALSLRLLRLVLGLLLRQLLHTRPLRLSSRSVVLCFSVYRVGFVCGFLCIVDSIRSVHDYYDLSIDSTKTMRSRADLNRDRWIQSPEC